MVQLDLDAEKVHSLGLAEVDRITDLIRIELGITDENAYRRRVADDPALYASSPADLEHRYQRHLEHLAEVVGDSFDELPQTPFRLRFKSRVQADEAGRPLPPQQRTAITSSAVSFLAEIADSYLPEYV